MRSSSDVGQVRAIAFDLMDTIVRDPFVAAIEAATGLPVDDVLARRDPSVYPAFERGEVDEDAYWAHYADAGIDANASVFHEVRRRQLTLLPGMGELLDELDGVVVRAIASNYPSWIDEILATHLPGRVEVVAASWQLGVRKPDAEFYEQLLSRLGVSDDEVLFVDDRRVNVEAAAALGIRSHLFRDTLTLRAWLRDEGVALAASSGQM